MPDVIELTSRQHPAADAAAQGAAPKRTPPAVRRELAYSLLADVPCISPKYFYDRLGSCLFTAICELDEYYPTRTEAQILSTHRDEIAAKAGLGTTLIDLGAGDCAKAAGLLPALRPVQYVPIDISEDFLLQSVQGLRQRFPDIEMTAIGQDFSASLDLPASVRQAKRLFFYPGSSIGNLTPAAALEFLQRLHHACAQQGDGALLIGVDLVKDSAVLDAAYDDALGVTAAFNLNLLRHVNRLLGSNFALEDWRHRGFFNPKLSRIEMHLETCRDLCVRWPGGQREFAKGERIHTENSYKYTRQGFLDLLERAGFSDLSTWTDAQGWFMVCHGRARR